MRIKLDENLGRRTTGRYRDAGHDVATVLDQALAGATDAQLFAVCADEGRLLVTLDLDFANPFRFDPATAAGIAVLRVPDLPGGADLEEATDTLIAAMARSDITGRLWVVDQRPYSRRDRGVDHPRAGDRR